MVSRTPKAFLLKSLMFPLMLLASTTSFAEEEFLMKDLIPIYVSATTDLQPISTDEMIKAHRELLNYIKDPNHTAEILSRIADLELMLQDQLVAKAEDEGKAPYKPNYWRAIGVYKEVLERYPNRNKNDQIYYQLAKAYQMSGQTKSTLASLSKLVDAYPYSEYFVEAQFRRGEILFALNQLKDAQIAYQAVLDNGQQTAFYENALYMHGWTLFKRGQYDDSLVSFSKVLDLTMPPSGKLDGVVQNKRALVEDSLRVMGITFSYLDGAKTITETYARIGSRAYEGLLYEQLGDLYVSQQRYQDAINTYRIYMDKVPYNYVVPVLHNKMIDTMILAKFFNKAFEEKENFIKKYDLSTSFYMSSQDDQKDYLRRYLYTYIDEVARFYHARAQSRKKRLASYQVPPPAKKEEMLQDYKTATQYYERFIGAFYNDYHAPEKSFLMGEAYSEIGEYERAIASYERTAYEFPINDYSADAAYASILGYRKLLKAEKNEDVRKSIVRRKLESQLKFVDAYSFSKFARPVLLDSVDTLYTEKEYGRAIEQAKKVQAMKPEGDEKERLTIWLILGHSNFELANYVEAESAYNEVLPLMPLSDNRRPEVLDRIAASVYRQAEALARAGKQLEAADEFLRVLKVAPKSKYRKNAEYDAATYLLIEKQWDRALKVLTSYRNQYDPKKESLDLSSKVLAALEGLERYDEAATELTRVSALTGDPEKKRQALFLSAEYYEKAGNAPRALQMFKEYVGKYPRPFELAMETRFRISEMYRKKDDEGSMRWWLKEIIKYDEKQPEAVTDRTKYLAAYSHNVFAEDLRVEFEKIKLTLPLKKSLAAKKKALKTALDKYQKILDYGVQDFSTQATYYVADIYAQLSRDLIDSQRPKGLNVLELEQYEILLEEQALPFEEDAIKVHESNLEYGWKGNFDDWVEKSITALAEILPGRYLKPEEKGEFSDVLY